MNRYICKLCNKYYLTFESLREHNYFFHDIRAKDDRFKINPLLKSNSDKESLNFLSKNYNSYYEYIKRKDENNKLSINEVSKPIDLNTTLSSSKALNNETPKQSPRADGYYQSLFQRRYKSSNSKFGFEPRLINIDNEFDEDIDIIQKPKKLVKNPQLLKPIEKKQINLVLSIESLNDLIKLGNDVDSKYILSPNVEYNINLKMIKNLIPEMESLNNMIGQKTIKKQVAELILYHSLQLHTMDSDLLHTIIDGEPGTGKTEFAKRIAKIYLKMGVLKKDIFKKVKRSDLIAGYLGQTALKTADVLDEVKGGVLFIDEAYSLGNSQGKKSSDSFSKECIDLINQTLTEMRDNPDDYFILMIAGYKDDLKKNFFSLNDGLERRFSIHYTMEPYSSEDLIEIFKKKVRDNKWDISDDAINPEFIEKNKNYFKYWGGDMELLFTKCKIAHSKNLISGKNQTKLLLNKADIEDGLQIFKENSNIKERKETINSNNHMYI
jgi:SpoVK/Ycf46/Vps4 family AAA+-type ATPase